MIVVNTIGPKELHRRILRSKPVCVVAAPCDQINSKLLDVIDQVRNKQNLTFLPPSRMPLPHCTVCRVQRLTRDWLTVLEEVGSVDVSFVKASNRFCSLKSFVLLCLPGKLICRLVF